MRTFRDASRFWFHLFFFALSVLSAAGVWTITRIDELKPVVSFSLTGVLVIAAIWCLSRVGLSTVTFDGYRYYRCEPGC